MASFVLKTKHVNSKKILAEITDFVDDIATHFTISWNRHSSLDIVIEVIEELLEELSAAGKINQCNVVCDGRNNKPNLDHTNLEISFMQTNCFNTTHIKYVINHT